MSTVKILFGLEPDEDGYPPIGSESLNAIACEDGRYRLDNTPFFVEGVSLGDVVEAVKSVGSALNFKRVHTQSSNTSLSIILLDADVRESLVRYLEGMDCYCEYGEFPTMEALAVSVPATAPYADVTGHLEELEDRGLISYAELALYEGGEDASPRD